jgi:hypothetical protein
MEENNVYIIAYNAGQEIANKIIQVFGYDNEPRDIIEHIKNEFISGYVDAWNA